MMLETNETIKVTPRGEHNDRWPAAYCSGCSRLMTKKLKK